jgi:hypothetical protein
MVRSLRWISENGVTYFYLKKILIRLTDLCQKKYYCAINTTTALFDSYFFRLLIVILNFQESYFNINLDRIGYIWNKFKKRIYILVIKFTLTFERAYRFTHANATIKIKQFWLLTTRLWGSHYKFHGNAFIWSVIYENVNLDRGSRLVWM